MQQIVAFSPEHFDAIEWQESQQAGQVLFQREWIDDIIASGTAQSLVDGDGSVIACAGLIPTRILRVANGPDQVQESIAWAIFSPRLPYHAKTIIKALRAVLDDRPETRIEAYVDAGQPKAAAFLGRLGFAYERTLSEPTPDGRTLHLFARVRG